MHPFQEFRSKYQQKNTFEPAESKKPLKKEAILNRLRNAPYVALFSLLSVITPANGEIGLGQSAVGYKENSPLKEAYEYVDQSYKDADLNVQVYKMLHSRAERNNLGNLKATDAEINTALLKQTDSVVKAMKRQGIKNPEWSDLKSFRGDDVMAEEMATIEDGLGAESMAAHTRAAFSEKTPELKIILNNLEQTESTNNGWEQNEQVVDIKDMSLEQLRQRFGVTSQNDQSTPSADNISANKTVLPRPELRPITPEQFKQASELRTEDSANNADQKFEQVTPNTTVKGSPTDELFSPENLAKNIITPEQISKMKELNPQHFTESEPVAPTLTPDTTKSDLKSDGVVELEAEDDRVRVTSEASTENEPDAKEVSNSKSWFSSFKKPDWVKAPEAFRVFTEPKAYTKDLWAQFVVDAESSIFPMFLALFGVTAYIVYSEYKESAKAYIKKRKEAKNGFKDLSKDEDVKTLNSNDPNGGYIEDQPTKLEKAKAKANNIFKNIKGLFTKKNTRSGDTGLDNTSIIDVPSQNIQVDAPVSVTPPLIQASEETQDTVTLAPQNTTSAIVTQSQSSDIQAPLRVIDKNAKYVTDSGVMLYDLNSFTREEICAAMKQRKNLKQYANKPWKSKSEVSKMFFHDDLIEEEKIALQENLAVFEKNKIFFGKSFSRKGKRSDLFNLYLFVIKQKKSNIEAFKRRIESEYLLSLEGGYHRFIHFEEKRTKIQKIADYLRGN